MSLDSDELHAGQSMILVCNFYGGNKEEIMCTSWQLQYDSLDKRR